MLPSMELGQYSASSHQTVKNIRLLTIAANYFYDWEKECLAIKLGVYAFRDYLLGQLFVVQTDHRSLEWLHQLKENNVTLTRWSL
jgi:hypothetical protein